MMIFLNLILIIVQILVIICFYKSPIGTLTFGYGLGDFFYLLVCKIAVVIHLIWIIMLRIKKSPPNKYRKPLIIYTIILLWIFYNLSYGRGAGFPWNGKLFNTF
jgi:uncharacterized Tic20 family protein